VAEKNTSTGRYAYEGLDRVIHEKARLGILASLATHGDGLSFVDLKSLCALTDGNLSRHLDVLSEADLVAVEKGYSGRRPQTVFRLTPLGRKRFTAYLSQLEAVIADCQIAPAKSSRSSRPALEPS
jgi:DNA-binding MarR family transcriptional regulator